MEGLTDFVRDDTKFSLSRLLLLWTNTVVLGTLVVLSVKGLVPFNHVVTLILGIDGTLCGVYAVNTYRRNQDRCKPQEGQP